MAGTAGVAFWSGAYTSQVPANPWAGVDHNEGDACLSCHDGAGGNTGLLFAGTVYPNNGNTGVSGVQIGVRVGGQLYTAYSADRGSFWVVGELAADWSQAEIRIRNANGELQMVGDQQTPSGDCNSCHGGPQPRLEEPQPA